MAWRFTAPSNKGQTWARATLMKKGREMKAVKVNVSNQQEASFHHWGSFLACGSKATTSDPFVYLRTSWWSSRILTALLSSAAAAGGVEDFYENKLTVKLALISLHILPLLHTGPVLFKRGFGFKIVHKAVVSDVFVFVQASVQSSGDTTKKDKKWRKLPLVFCRQSGAELSMSY